ncbi:MAG: glycosyltransferase [Gammaproteobacteria bacterium]|nr:glycosyltransferase [Gammaproteobacteria bacterium]
MTQSIIFVTGMHRSGTSLVTKALNVVGVELGSNLIAAADDNPKGFFEDHDCFTLNEAILAQLNLRWDIATLMPDQDFSSQQLLPYIKDAAHLIKTKLGKSSVFALKDPRFSVLMPIWLSAARMVKVDPLFVICLRNPSDVAHSLWKRNSFDYQKGLDLWFSHHLSLMRYLADDQSKRIVTSYENLLNEPEKQLKRLGKFVNPDFNEVENQDQMSMFSSEFVEADLAHSRSDNGDIDQSLSATPDLIDLYDVLNSFANGRWSKDKTSKLLGTIDPYQAESRFFRNQLSCFNQEIHQALGKQYHELQDKFKEDYAELLSEAATAKVTAEQKQQFIEQLQSQYQHTLQGLESKLEQLADNNAELESKVKSLNVICDQSTRLIRERGKAIRTKQRELFDAERTAIDLAKRCDQLDQTVQQQATQHAELEQLQTNTDRHLQGAITRIDDIQNSLSYKTGRAVTWPLRMPYDVLLEPLAKNPQNLKLLAELISQVVRHPVKSTQLLRWEIIRNAYITFFKDPAIAGQVVEHYKREFEGENYQADFATPDASLQEHAGSSAELRFSESDRVSVFIVNYNGRQHLDELLNSLQHQSYTDFEIIIIDNGSQDGSVDEIKQNYPDVRLIALHDNTGFAEANNIAAEVASGRYYFLLNNDTTLDKDCISHLVRSIKQSDSVGAAGSKLLFWKPFVDIELTIQPASLKRRIFVDIDTLHNSLPVYPKLFFATGWRDAQQSHQRYARSFDKKALLRLPVCEAQTSARLAMFSGSKKPVKVLARTSVETEQELILDPGQWTEFSLDFSDRLEHPGLHYLINNAGSHVDNQGQAQDRGFGSPDHDQYNVLEPVAALCGGAMMIRPEILGDMPVFGKDFFAYFEDTDLSLRIRELGYQLMYCPDSIVYHKHASTSQENSAFFRFYVNRNRLLFLALHYPKLSKQAEQNSRAELNHLQQYLQENSKDPEELEFARRIPEIFDDWQTLLPKIANKTFFDRPNRFPKLAVYNNFWHTLGGGEHHACVIAQALQSLGPVDLISEHDFSIEQLELQFNIHLKHCRKRLVSSVAMHHNPETTAYYDIFVNSTYSSDLSSHAKYSYYVVSFPYQIPKYPAEKREFLNSYDVFLANSSYTAGWVKQWWDVDNCVVLYPSIALPDLNPDQLKKYRVILNVGRFFRSGHNKKQLELVQVFKRLIDSGNIDNNWKLILVGQVDPSQQAYLDEVREEAQGYPIEINNNIELDALREIYSQAAIYWHATGMGESTERNPERNEHFGISTVEAMSYGCLPIVINAGGQPESVSNGENGFLFDNEQQLEQFSLDSIELFETNPERYQTMSACAVARAQFFSRTNTEQTLLQCLKDSGIKIELGDRLL